jgi:nitroreductase
MNEAMENLLTRRSVRKYEPRQISDEELNAVLEAGTYAPTARGTQSPLIIAVQDRADRDELSRINARIWGREDFDPFYGAPTVVLVLGQAGNPNGVQDASLVLGNLMNAAHAVGLGSCWINRIRETFELPEGRALLEKWGVEGDWVGVGSCILGYAAGSEPAPAARKPGYYRIIR